MSNYYKIVFSNLSEILQKEWEEYNTFLDDENISSLPDGFYKGGVKLDYAELRRLRDKYNENNKNN